jgi:hypothetical protein
VPPPLEGDDQLITSVITAGFLVALVVLLIVRHRLAPADHWWIWTAASGTALGLFGLAYVPHLKRSRARAAARRTAAHDTAASTAHTSTTTASTTGAGDTAPGDAAPGNTRHGDAVRDDARSDTTEAQPPS